MKPQSLRHATLPHFVKSCVLGGLALALACCQPSHDKGASRLLRSSSPYLRDHADNPVNWYEWSDEAFDLAKEQNKPVIVSIGYSACHWCHVMERESFMDAEVAEIMNENFICIKVDREERPDVDQQFVFASQALTGTAGWPLNAFATQDGKPFHTVTYNTKAEWIDLLKRVSKSWKDDPNQIKKQANNLTEGIKPLFEYMGDTTLRLDLRAFQNHIPAMYSSLDFNNGGLKGAPKFPMPSLIEFMLQHYHLTGDERAGRWVFKTLDAMASGGIYDHVGGGFGRYSTDSLWQVPHFEKMLYDNAQLVSVYAKAFKVTNNRRYATVISQTLQFIRGELTSDKYLFFSSVDADSDHEEGKLYKWTTDEVKSIIGEAKMDFVRVSKDSILTIDANGYATNDIDLLRQQLYDARNRPNYSSIDEKVITSWNAMMLTGYIDAFTALSTESDEKIRRLLNSLNARMFRNGGVLRSVLHDTASVTEGYLEDYAWLAKANIGMYETTLDVSYLQVAKDITDIAMTRFKNDNSPFFYYSASPDARLIRSTELFDQAIPSSNSVFAEVLLKLGEYYQDEHYTTAAHRAIKEAISSLDIDGTTISNWARLAEIVHYKPYEIAIVGDEPGVSNANRLLQFKYLPTAFFMGGTKENLPLLENKLIPGQTTIYVCRDRTCKLPVTKPEDAVKQIVYR